MYNPLNSQSSTNSSSSYVPLVQRVKDAMKGFGESISTLYSQRRSGQIRRGTLIGLCVVIVAGTAVVYQSVIVPKLAELKQYQAAEKNQAEIKARQKFEADQIQRVLGNDNLVRPAFPLAKFTIDKKTGEYSVEEYPFIPLGGLRCIGTPEGLIRYAEGLTKGYDPNRPDVTDPNASIADANTFEDFVNVLATQDSGLDQEIIKKLDTPGGVSSLDLMVALSNELRASRDPNNSNYNPHLSGIIRRQYGNTLTLFGNKSQINGMLKSHVHVRKGRR